ncbi:hypothetical protein RCL1_004073 [Eukaryota sp. TZLM3-RCL]
MQAPVLYFLCTGNSCRSQMAEGLGKKILGDRVQVFSAGIEAHGVNARAVRSMQEVGIDISNQTSDVIDSTILSQSRWVVTLCANAESRCPLIPSNVTHLHWDFPDPAKAEGSEDEIMKMFASTRDSIAARIERFKQELE